jgi:hypothetical protein
MPFGQEPECGHENAMFSGRVVYILGSLHIEVVSAVQEPYRKFSDVCGWRAIMLT